RFSTKAIPPTNLKHYQPQQLQTLLQHQIQTKSQSNNSSFFLTNENPTLYPPKTYSKTPLSTPKTSHASTITS
ncbi:hypothetical protein, partial [Staphylococcus aureus]|uniref:hypothetical protein n=1 Tax=Staphylococcus aureus TaxID=1280 RepID=UPI001C92DFC6